MSFGDWRSRAREWWEVNEAAATAAEWFHVGVTLVALGVFSHWWAWLAIGNVALITVRHALAWRRSRKLAKQLHEIRTAALRAAAPRPTVAPRVCVCPACVQRARDILAQAGEAER